MHRQRLRFRRIRVRITTAGWSYIIMTILVGAAAVNTTNNLLYLVTSTLLALMAASGWLALRALRKLEFELYLPRELFAGQATPIHFKVLNPRHHLSTFLLRLQRGEHSAQVIEVPPRGSADGTLAFAFDRRGVHELGDVLVTSTFPFGLFSRGGYVRVDGRVLVYPAPGTPSRPASRRRGTEPVGPQRSAHRRGGRLPRHPPVPPRRRPRSHRLEDLESGHGPLRQGVLRAGRPAACY